MKNKKLIIGALLTTILVSGCGKLEKGTSSIDPKKTGSNTTITTGRVDDTVYQALMVEGKYETSKARGLTASRLNSQYNLGNFENGLINLSKENYSVDKYYFREGQGIDKDTLLSWVSRKSGDNPEGLNPEKKDEPIIFQQLLEQNYVNRDSKSVGGVSLGIALNKVDYSGDNPIEIDDSTLEAEGKRIANKIIANYRELENMQKVPITVGLFRQAPRDNLAGGSYFAKGTTKGKTIDKWDNVEEEYISLPVQEDDKNAATEDGLSNKYDDFKSSVQGFFPNLSGFSSVAYYREKNLQKLTIKIETKYYSKTEIISFTQYVGKKVEEILNVNGAVEVQINSIEGPQGFIEKKSGTNQVTSHIFD